MKKRPILERLEENIFYSPDGCWYWLGNLSQTGYGKIYWNRRHCVAHRVAYEVWRGVKPAELLVCHSCDNKMCINPDHLFLGTSLDNNRDAIKKGRAYKAHGEQHYKAKLTKEQVIEIRSLFGKEMDITIASKFNVSPQCISGIKKKRRWLLQK
jgi:hypothetical protein